MHTSQVREASLSLPSVIKKAQPDRLRRAVLAVAPLVALGLFGCATSRRTGAQVIAPFSTAESGALPREWEEVALRRDLPRTQYRVAQADGQRVLHASGHGASGLRCLVQADANATPTLRWSWRTREVPPSMRVDRSETDDSPARIAVAFEGDERLLSWRDRALSELVQLITGERLPYATLMYVWDAQLPVDSLVDCARTSRIRYLVVESGSERAGRWLRYSRDVVKDFRRAFGEEPGPIASVGVMVDGDDLKVDLDTWFGDIRLQPA